MGKIGFGTQMFGFKKSDVNAYLEKLHRDFAAEKQAQKQKTELLEQQLKEQAQANAALAEQLADAQQQLNGYKEKEAEIEKMSVSIGTMYLVARQSADEMVSAAEQYAREVSDYSKKQLEAADRAGEQLAAVRNGLTESANRFANDIAALTDSLDGARHALNDRLEHIDSLPPSSAEPENGGTDQ